jgi:hypothetical protein
VWGGVHYEKVASGDAWLYDPDWSQNLSCPSIPPGLITAQFFDPAHVILLNKAVVRL